MAATAQLDGLQLDVGLSTDPFRRFVLSFWAHRSVGSSEVSGDFGGSAVLHQRWQLSTRKPEEFGEGSPEAVQRYLGLAFGRSPRSLISYVFCVILVHSPLANGASNMYYEHVCSLCSRNRGMLDLLIMTVS